MYSIRSTPFFVFAVVFLLIPLVFLALDLRRLSGPIPFAFGPFRRIQTEIHTVKYAAVAVLAVTATSAVARDLLCLFDSENSACGCTNLTG